MMPDLEGVMQSWEDFVTKSRKVERRSLWNLVDCQVVTMFGEVKRPSLFVIVIGR